VLRRVPALLSRKKSQRSAEDDFRRLQSRHRRGYVYRALLSALGLIGAGWLLSSYGSPPTQSDIDAKALLAPKVARSFHPPHPIEPKALGSVDMELVHGELFPAWVISLQHKPHSIGHADAERAFAALRDEAGKDRNLRVLLDQLHDKVMDGSYDFGGEIQALIKGWNDYLAEASVPFRLEHHLARSVKGPEHRLRCYRVVAKVPLSEQGSTQHVLVLARQDRTNLVEGFLGQTSTEPDTALVMTDRIAEYTLERVWPLFDPEAEAQSPSSELLARVRSEARQALSASTIDTLTRAFAMRRHLEAELLELSRRRGCGGGILIERVPWNGLSERALALVSRVAEKNQRRGCPRVTQADADHINALSQRLREHPGLVRALGSLAALLGKSVVAHEGRHLADNARHAGLRGAGFCPNCPPTFDDATRAEVSAYLASFATPSAGYLGLLQACGTAPERRGAHSRALEFLLPKLLVAGCSGPIPEDLYARAAALHAELFGPTPALDFARGSPSTFPLPVD